MGDTRQPFACMHKRRACCPGCHRLHALRRERILIGCHSSLLLLEPAPTVWAIGHPVFLGRSFYKTECLPAGCFPPAVVIVHIGPGASVVTHRWPPSASVRYAIHTRRRQDSPLHQDTALSFRRDILLSFHRRELGHQLDSRTLHMGYTDHHNCSFADIALRCRLHFYSSLASSCLFIPPWRVYENTTFGARQPLRPHRRNDAPFRGTGWAYDKADPVWPMISELDNVAHPLPLSTAYTHTRRFRLRAVQHNLLYGPSGAVCHTVIWYPNFLCLD